VTQRKKNQMFRIAITAFLITFLGVKDLLEFGEPISPSPLEWKQSIERPNKDWDFDGKRILGHIDNDICLWDAATGQLLHRMKAHRERIQKVQFSPNGAYALSSSWISAGPMVPFKSKDTRTILWDLATGQSKQLLPDQVAGEFSPDGERIVTFSQRPDKTSSFNAAIWDVLTGQKLVKVTLDGGSGPRFDDLHFSLDGTRFVHIHAQTRGAVLYDSRDGREAGRVSDCSGIIRYTSTGTLACFDLYKEPGTISQIDIESGRTLWSFEHGKKVEEGWSGAWAHDGRKVAAFSIHGPIRIWDTETGAAITGAQGGQYPRYDTIISPDNSRLAILSGGGNVNHKEVEPQFGLYDLNTGAEVCLFGLTRTGVLIGFSPDSKSLAVGGSKLDVYNSADGTKISGFTSEPTKMP